MASVSQLAEMLVGKGIFTEKDSAVKGIIKNLNLGVHVDSNHKIDLDAFERISLITMFKDSLVDMLRHLDEKYEADTLGLGVKIGNYQRNKVKAGIKAQVKGDVELDFVLSGEGSEVLNSALRKSLMIKEGISKEQAELNTDTLERVRGKSNTSQMKNIDGQQLID